MSGLISSGHAKRGIAMKGFAKVAELDTQRANMQDSLDAAADQQEKALLGTGAGIGAQYGISKAIAAKQATAAGSMSPAIAAPVTKTTAALGSAAPGVNTAATGKAGLALSKAVPGAQAAAGGGLSAAGSGAAVAGQSAAAGTGAAAAGSTAGAAGAGSAASGAMATLGTIAAPIAIGIGAAFLLNKLFG